MRKRRRMSTLRVVLLLAAASCSSSSSPTADAGPLPAGTAITGMLGTLGAAQATVSSFMISNSGETLIYFSSSPLTCSQLTMSRWLGGTVAGKQVVEIVLHGQPVVGDLQVPPAEVNYAPGGMSSANEVSADSGKITFTVANPMGDVAGSFSATYGADSIAGTFHATFCPNGQGY